MATFTDFVTIPSQPDVNSVCSFFDGRNPIRNGPSVMPKPTVGLEVKRYFVLTAHGSRLTALGSRRTPLMTLCASVCWSAAISKKFTWLLSQILKFFLYCP
ncbi:hypothetical protein Bcep1808_3617 [Burkholderia vietnamiensis G4]|uniref:Uncharacterized protein n=1 Tax=Burkholderia vietnamiensis (strain G4 / LMG 22486) TaxID=269482 RepID=A4JK00_BURVG|nr:hypothetical protein Bcep1808_3617 [Burkholderia vietnamiensis G4]